MSFKIENHQKSNRVRVIKFQESDLDRLIFPFKKHTILSLEYKPFSRFSLAKSLDEVFGNKLSQTLVKILNDREKEIITARRLAEEPKTLEELSKQYKISRERIRQIETKAFEKLQKSMINASKSKNLLPAN